MADYAVLAKELIDFPSKTLITLVILSAEGSGSTWIHPFYTHGIVGTILKMLDLGVKEEKDEENCFQILFSLVSHSIHPLITRGYLEYAKRVLSSPKCTEQQSRWNCRILARIAPVTGTILHEMGFPDIVKTLKPNYNAIELRRLLENSKKNRDVETQCVCNLS